MNALVQDDVMRFRRCLERETAKIYAEEKEVAEHEGREMNKKKITNQIESDSDESDLEKNLNSTPEDTVQTKIRMKTCQMIVKKTEKQMILCRTKVMQWRRRKEMILCRTKMMQRRRRKQVILCRTKMMRRLM